MGLRERAGYLIPMKLLILILAAMSAMAQTYSAVSTSDVTHSSVKVVWTTNTSAGTYVRYGLTASYDRATDCNFATTSHQCYMSGLESGTLYHYAVCASAGSCDGTDRTFTTLAAPSPHPASPTLPTSTTLPSNPTVWETDVLASNCSDIQTRITAAAAADGALNHRIRIPVTWDCAVGLPASGSAEASPLYFPAKSGANSSGSGWIVLEPDWTGADAIPEGVRVSPTFFGKMPTIRVPPSVAAIPAPQSTGTCQAGQLWLDYNIYSVGGWSLKECTTPGTNTYSLVAKTDFSGSGTSCAVNHSWYNKTDAVGENYRLHWCADGVLYRVHMGSICVDAGAFCLAANAHHYRLNGIQIKPVPLFSSGTIPAWHKNLYANHFSFASVLISGNASGVHDIVLDRLNIDYEFPYRIRNVWYGKSDGFVFANSRVKADYVAPSIDDVGCNPCHTAVAQLTGGVGALITNNYTESAGITYFSSDDLETTNTDVTISYNDFVNGPKHQAGTAENIAYCGGTACFPMNRHAIELKRGVRWLIERNTFTYHVSSSVNQGDLIALSSRPGANSLPITDVTVRYNTVNGTPNFAYVQGHNTFNQMASVISRVSFDSNLIYGIDGALVHTGGVAREGRAFRLFYGTEDVAITRNLIRNDCTGYAPWLALEESGPSEGLVLRDNIAWACSVGAPYYWVGKTSVGGGITGLNAGWPTTGGWAMATNAIVEAGAGFNTGSGYPTGNFFTTVSAVGFANAAANDYRLAGGSPFRSGSSVVTNVSGPSSTGADLGPDFASLPSAISAMVVTPTSSAAQFTFTAPSTGACYIDTSTSAAYTSATRTTDVTGTLSRSITVSGLASSTTYYYRVLCGGDVETGQFNTLAPGGWSTPNRGAFGKSSILGSSKVL